MKATIDIPEELYRLLKARSALEGRTIRDVTIDLYRRWVAERVATVSGPDAERWLAEWAILGQESLKGAPPAPTATEILSDGRCRTERR